MTRSILSLAFSGFTTLVGIAAPTGMRFAPMPAPLRRQPVSPVPATPSTPASRPVVPASPVPTVRPGAQPAVGRDTDAAWYRRHVRNVRARRGV